MIFGFVGAQRAVPDNIWVQHAVPLQTYIGRSYVFFHKAVKSITIFG